MKKKWGFNHGMQEGALLFLLGGWLLWYSLDAYQHSYIKDWLQSPSLFPVVVSCLLGLFGVIIFTQGIKAGETETQKGGNTVQVLVLLGMSLAYYLALSVIDLPYMALTIGSLTFALSVFELAPVVLSGCAQQGRAGICTHRHEHIPEHYVPHAAARAAAVRREK